MGVYFVTQSPSDIPDSVLGQLGNRVQHALRAFTPKDQAAVRAAAQTFRANPAFKTEQAITELGTGEALVSVLDAKGAPSMVEMAKVLFPLSQIGAIDPAQRREIMQRSRIAGKYDDAIDRHTAYEKIAERRQAEDQARERQEQEQARAKEEAKAKKAPAKKKKSEKSLFGAIVTTLVGTFVRKVANEAAKAVTSGMKKKR